MNNLHDLQLRYADLVARFGINLQPGQNVLISAEVITRDFVALLVEACYRAGAGFVQIQWEEPRTKRAHMLHAPDKAIDEIPEFEKARYQQLTQEKWARIALSSEEIPSFLDDVDPNRLSRQRRARSRAFKSYVEAQMSMQFQWCVVAVPTEAKAKQVFPDLSPEEGFGKLWGLVLQMVRADQEDPVAAWRAHDAQLKKVAAFMAKNKVRAIRYFDATVAEDGKACTDLTVGLTDAPLWVGGSGFTPEGVEFMANMPTEEVFCTPHRMKAHGWTRTSKPIYPLQREVLGAYFRFENGECVEARAQQGEAVLKQFLDIDGARRLGEVSLVDVRSPVNQTGLVFYDTLFDENASCHIAFGKAYSECVEGAEKMSEEERVAFGLNHSDAHEDFMIGTPTMDVLGTRADGSTIDIMRAGRFVDAIFA